MRRTSVTDEDGGETAPAIGDNHSGGSDGQRGRLISEEGMAVGTVGCVFTLINI